MVFALQPVQRTVQSDYSSDRNVVAFNPYKTISFKRSDCLPAYDHGLWRIQSGYVRTFTWNDQGDSVSLGFWQAGDIFGQAIAQMTPYEAQCLTPVIADYLGNNYTFSRESALAHARQSNDLLKITHCRQTDQRLLHFLCWLATRFGQPTAEGREVSIKLIHQEIADSIGCTRVTVTRILKQLEREGKIQWTANKKLVYAKTLAAFEVPAY